MKKLALALVLFSPSLAQAADSAWVQAVAGGYEARIVTASAGCPALHTDRGDAPMTVRAAADSNFALTCAAPIPVGVTMAGIGDSVLPVPVGAKISVFSPRAMTGQPWTCGAVGRGNVFRNHAAVIG